MKANHKHQYRMYLKQRENNPSRFDLCKRCTICGLDKDVEFRKHLCKRPDGTLMWMTHIEEFFKVYGELPIVYVQSQK